jgi:glycosyltransferase involved in cell wall biosynthesis
LSTITNNQTETLATDTKTLARGGVAQRTTSAAGDGSARPPVLSIVVPCFDEEEVVRLTAARLAALVARLASVGKIDAASFVYFVDDGSRDATWAVVAELHRADPTIKGLKLARNVGMQNALLAGLLSVKDHADCAVTIDADLQQDEQAIEIFLERYARGAHIVCGVRRSRSTDSWLKRVTATFFYNLMNLMGAKITKHHAEYRLLSSKALAALAEYRESNLFLRGIVADLGLRTENVAFDVHPRAAGQTKHSPRKMIGLALDGITSFSVVPLRLVTAAGALIFLFSCAMMLFYFYQKLKGYTLPGWAGTTIPIYFLGGVQIMFLGLVGEYIGKIYKEVKARPRYIKDEELF